MRKLIGICLLILFTGLQCSKPKQATRSPNIVLIMADDMGYSDIGCYGAVQTETPNIDKLAEDGIRFTRFYNNAWCSPTRASLLTGLYPQQAGMAVLAGPKEGPPGPYEGYLNNHCVTIAEVLKRAGYNTYMSGKWHLGEHQQYWPTKRGFDHYFGLISGASNYFDLAKTKVDTTVSDRKIVRHMALDGEPYYPPKEGFFMTRAVTKHALDMLNRKENRNSPFFLYLAYKAPHWPLQALPEDIAKFKGKFDEGWDSLRHQRYRRQQALGTLGSESPLSPREEEVPAWTSLSEEKKKEMAQKMEVYAAQIYRMDKGIGKVIDKIKSMGEEENTIIIFLSDNGASAEGGIWGFNRRHNGLPPGGVDSYMSYGRSWANLSNTPFQYFKKWLHEGGIATPLIVKWPAKIEQNRRGNILQQSVDQSGHVKDLMPTLIEATGAHYPANFKGEEVLPLEGKSILPLIEGKKEWKREKPLFWALNGHKAMIKGKWKIDAVSMDTSWELYNLQEDRSELHNLAGKYPDKVKSMAALWHDWAERVGVFEGQQNIWHRDE